MPNIANMSGYNLDPTVLEDYAKLGVDTDEFLNLLQQATPDPITGEIGPEEIMRFMIRNMDNPIVQKVGAAAQVAIKQRVESHDADFTDFDFHSLAGTIPQDPVEGWWHITLERFAVANTSGNYIKEEEIHSTPGAQPVFFLSCEHKNVIRAMEQVTGLPDSTAVLRFIKRSMVTPMPGLFAALPRFLHITVKLSPHAEALRPFLDSLPAPFEWEIETPEIAATVNDALDARMQEKHATYMSQADVHKHVGNAAFNRKDRALAIEQYTLAINFARDASGTRRAEEEKTVSRQFTAVCLANRAAAYLMDGEGRNPEKALADSQEVERLHPDYAKGYYRQARAHEGLGNISEAQETLRRALSRPALATDKTLLTLLNELDTQLD